MRESSFAGRLTSRIVGRRFHAAGVGPGERVILVRNAGNRYDANAVEVRNVFGRMLGHLPRSHAAHLAPLLDADRIEVFGRVMDDPDEAEVELLVDVLLTPQGLDILLPEQEDDARSMLHVFLAVLFHSRDAGPRALRDLGRMLGPVFERHVLPEAWLISRMLPWKAAAVEVRRLAPVREQEAGPSLPLQ